MILNSYGRIFDMHSVWDSMCARQGGWMKVQTHFENTLDAYAPAICR